ncbi:GYDIA family GHMP kinase [Flavobacterium sp.]|uniref:GYDIA family GHMP kinase n=1 Tax=Flavobacterium sp. TaxID=239 RepID=UPI0039E46719
MKQTFYSNGKLFITGEYLVLDGAKAFALPTKFGQDLVVENGSGKTICWKSFDVDGSLWFEAELPLDAIAANLKTDDAVKNTLIEILHTADRMNPDLLQAEGYSVTTRLTFPKFWGLGTSSTLINNVAQWFGIDAYQLLWSSFGGSGYDIACAQNDGALVYTVNNRNPKVELVDFEPTFAKQLYFVYLNQKQDSKSAIAAYNAKKGNLQNEIAQVDALTDQILRTQDLQTFCSLLEQHENILSGILEMQTIKQRLFPDFVGTVKSLGAWGGDFVLAVSETDPTGYFKDKGYDTVIRYSDMIL